MENEIMFEEVIENVEEYVPTNSGSGLKKWIIGAALAGAGYLLYKKVVKPRIQKHKAAKEEHTKQYDDAVIIDEESENNV